MIELKFSFFTMDDLQDFVAKVNSPPPITTGPEELKVPAEPVVGKYRKVTPKRTRLADPFFEEHQESEPPARVVAQDYPTEQVEAPVAVVDHPQPTRDEALAALQKLNEVHGLEAAERVMAGFYGSDGAAERFSDVKPEDYSGFIAACLGAIDAAT